MTPLHVRRAADHRRMRWKNGGGDTTEIAVHPAGADLDQLGWRVSLATMTADGPFSTFAGLERTLTVVHGDGLALSIGLDDSVRLTAASDPLLFPADVACTARLLAGPVTDLNVMTRRSGFRHAVRRLDLSAPLTVAAEATTLLLCCGGRVAVGDHLLERHDVLVSSGPQTLHLIPASPGATGMLITVRPA